MEIILILLIVWAVWYFTKKHSQKSMILPINDLVDKPRNYSEEEVLSFQTRFERKLEEEIDYPDGICFKSLYIYINLMRKWYSELSGKYRYDDQMIQKIRNDWVDYVYSMENVATTNYLYFENEGEDADRYREETVNTSRKLFAIEDGFASYLGEDAIKELKRVHDLDHWKINKKGEMAPEGKRFTALGDLLDDKNEE